jgi:hypothetical protein
MSMRFKGCALILAAFGVVGCRSKTGSGMGDTAAVAHEAGSLEGARRDSARDTAAAGTGGMAGMSGRAGMSGMMNDAIMDSMQARMRMMTAASPAQMKAMLPVHRQMVANMLSQMNDEMRKMNMPASAAWTATVDSVRQDLVHEPDMSVRELGTNMGAHCARVSRLLEMHRAMMPKSPVASASSPRSQATGRGF